MSLRFHASRNRAVSTPLVVRNRFEAALSFSSILVLVGALHDLAAAGSQVLCATHSPVLAALPGATILEVGDWGLRPSSWDDLVLVQNWRAYLADPHRYLRHIIDAP